MLGEEMFGEDCQAWVHGAVYPKAYSTFKRFKYMPLPRAETKTSFKEEELKILNAVKLCCFDVYCAKALEKYVIGKNHAKKLEKIVLKMTHAKKSLIKKIFFYIMPMLHKSIR